jgi:PilZ domain
MAEKRQISGRKIIDDLRSGKTDQELQMKYRLSPNGLRTIFEKLVARNAISQSELCEISAFYKETTVVTGVRKCRRMALNVALPIYDIEGSCTGILRDISENGLRVAGIEARVGEAKTFQIPIDMFMQADPLLIVAKCKWVKTKGKTTEYVVAGFEIVDLSQGDTETLLNFVRFLVLSESGEWNALKSPADSSDLRQCC